MKAKVKGIDMEGSPEEMAKFFASYDEVCEDKQYETVHYEAKAIKPAKILSKHNAMESARNITVGKQLPAIMKMLSERPALLEKDRVEIGKEYCKFIKASSVYPSNYFYRNLEIAKKKLHFKEKVETKAVKISKGQPPKILAEMFRENPRLLDLEDKEILKAYSKKMDVIVHNTRRFYRNLAKAKKLFLKTGGFKSGRIGFSHGSSSEIVPRLLEMFRETPSIVEENKSVIWRAYAKKFNLMHKHNYSGGFARQIDKARLLFTKPAEVKDRIYTYGASPAFVNKIVDDMPDVFDSKIIIQKALNRLGISPDNIRKRNLVSSQIWYALMKLTKQGKLTFSKHNGYITYTKTGKTTHETPSFDSILGVPPISEEGGYIAPVKMDSTPDYEPPIISTETLDMVMSNHSSFGYEIFIGLKSKVGAYIDERTARFIFSDLMSNIAGLQKRYPGKKVSISGYGQYKSIEVKS